MSWKESEVEVIADRLALSEPVPMAAMLDWNTKILPPRSFCSDDSQMDKG